jgi:hypothetical protein
MNTVNKASLIVYFITVFRNRLLPTARTTLTMAREGTPQNFALRKVGKKIAYKIHADPVCRTLSYTE